MPLGFAPGTPVPLTESDISRLQDRISSELEESLRAHRALEDDLDRWERAYNAVPDSRVKDFPWPNACNVVIPLIGIAVDSIVARLVNTLFSVTPFWTVRPLRKETERLAKPIESALEWSRINEFDLYQEVRKFIPDVVTFGWGYMKVPWDVRIQRGFRPGPDGEAEPVEKIIRRPFPHWVPIRDVITQDGVADDLIQSEWIAHRFRLTDGAIRARALGSGFRDVEDVIPHKEDIHTRVAESADQTPGVVTGLAKPKLNTLYEFHADLPVLEAEGLPPSTVLTFHRPTRRLVRAIYNPFFSGRRPFVKAKFIERQGRKDGYGIARRLVDLQDELTTIHRQQVDNSTLANTRFFVGRRGVVKPNTRIWPGRFLTTPDPERDIKVIQLGDTYNSMRQLSVEILSYSERMSGVSDPSLGRESSVIGSRATATGTLAILQEGNRRFDLNIRDIRNALGEVGRITLELNHQFRPKGFFFLVQGEEGAFTEQVLDLPDDFTTTALAIELTASTATINRDVERQGLISLLGLLGQFYQQALQMQTLMAQPDLPPEARAFGAKAVSGATFVMERVLQTFDIKNIDAVLPTAVLEDSRNGNRGFGGSVQGSTPNGGMEDFLGAAQGNQT